MYPEYGMNTPLQDEQAIRREFAKKCRFDPRGAVLQLLKQRDLLIRRMKLWRQAEEQDTRAKRNGGTLFLHPDEKDVRDSLKNKKSYMKTWRNKWRTMKQAMNHHGRTSNGTYLLPCARTLERPLSCPLLSFQDVMLSSWPTRHEIFR